MTAPICPECKTGKHQNCDGRALDAPADTIVDCTCPDVSHRRVTREVTMSALAVREGMFSLPEGVSYLNLGTTVEGEFPHAADLGGCRGSLLIHVGRESLDLWCTRESGHAVHESPGHVAHIERGLPVAAWTEVGA